MARSRASRGPVVRRIEIFKLSAPYPEVDRLMNDYLAGGRVNELAERYSVHRAAVSSHLTHRGSRAGSRRSGRGREAPSGRCLDAGDLPKHEDRPQSCPRCLSRSDGHELNVTRRASARRHRSCLSSCRRQLLMSKRPEMTQSRHAVGVYPEGHDGDICLRSHRSGTCALSPALTHVTLRHLPLRCPPPNPSSTRLARPLDL